MSTSYQSVDWECDKAVLTLSLNRPERLNALDDGLLSDLHDALVQSAADDGVRVVIITGKGRGFCAGQDLKAFQAKGRADATAHLMRHYFPLILALAGHPKPTIAQINGVAAGAGMSLALATDLKVASRSAKFVQAFLGIGLVPDSGATFFLSRSLGIARTMELMLLGEPLDAPTAHQWGLINRVVEPEELEPFTTAWARRLAAGPPLALTMTKELVRQALLQELSGCMEREAECQGIAARTEDHHNALEAFAQKIPPVFHGR